MKITIFIIILFSQNSFAGIFSIINRSGGSNLIFDALEVEVNKSLPDADQSTYLKGMANSAVMSGKGVGLDYASNVELVSAGYSLGIGADLAGSGITDAINGSIKGNQFRGIGTTLAVVLGFNFGILPFSNIGPIELNRLNFFTNFMSAQTPKINGLSGEISNFGFHFQYKFMTPTGLGLINWGGIDLSFGYEYSKLKITFEQTLAQSIDLGGGVTGSISGTAKFGAEVQTHSFPFEISTSLRTLYMLTLYGGLGMDINLGHAKSIASITAPITTTIPAGTATGHLDLGEDSAPDAFLFRNFLGVQFNVSVARLFIQLNSSFTSDTLGIVLGLKIAY